MRQPTAASFTLVELLAVMIIIGLTLSLAVARADSIIPGFEIAREASSIATTLRDARTRAVVQGRILRLEIDLELGEMRYFYDEPGPEEDPLTFSSDEPFATKPWSDRVLLDHAYVGRDLVSGNQPVVMRFWPEGICSPVRLCVQHARSTDLRRTIRINPLTGLTTIERGFVDPEDYEYKSPAGGRR